MPGTATPPILPQQAPAQPTTGSDAVSLAISSAADLYAQQQDRKAAERYAREAEAAARNERANAESAAARVRADLARMGRNPAWLVPMILLGGGALALIYFRSAKKRR